MKAASIMAGYKLFEWVRMDWAGPRWAQPNCMSEVGGGHEDEGLRDTARANSSASSLGRTLSGVRNLEKVRGLPTQMVHGGDRLPVEAMERQQAQRQPQPQPHSHTAATDATKRTAGMAALYDDGTVVNPTAISGSPPPFGMFPSWIRREIL